MRKILSGVFVVTTTLAVPGVALAQDEPLPGRQPPCSILRDAQLHEGLCTQPVPDSTR